MRLILGKTNWERRDLSLNEICSQIADDGYSAAEFYLPRVSIPPAELRALVDDHGLALIADIATLGESPAEHLETLKEQAAYAVSAGALLINAHTGRDYFSYTENMRLFERSVELSRETRMPFAHETHRSRALYSAVETKRYLEALPELKLCADFSHWMTVHESDLRNQDGNVEAAIERSIHIHARVGFEEGPQVNNPAAPEWAGHLERHVELWRRIVSARKAEGSEFLTITPEFGPFPYMPRAPYTLEPLADAWEANLYMKRVIEEELA